MFDTPMKVAFVLLVIYQIKHYLADFPLQRQYMLKKVSPRWDFLLPLAVHCGVHAVMTLAIVLIMKPELWWLAIVDFAVHFVMDRIKSGPKYLGRYNDISKTSFWLALGFDQMVHHLTHIYIVWVIVQALFP